jgi:enoyl-CoA hydratase
MDASSKKPVLYYEEGGISRVVLDRPETLNAINKSLLQYLASVLDKIRSDDAVKAVIITGTGNEAFSAGADIDFLSQASPLEVREIAQAAVSVNNKIETLGKVVVAAINGYALGVVWSWQRLACSVWLLGMLG